MTTRPTTRSSVLASGVAWGTLHVSPFTCLDSSKHVMLMRSASLRSSANVLAPANRCARPAHLGERTFAVAGGHVDRADGVLQHHHVEALAPRVQDRRPYTVIGCQAGHVETSDIVLAQPLGKPGAVECRVR